MLHQVMPGQRNEVNHDNELDEAAIVNALQSNDIHERNNHVENSTPVSPKQMTGQFNSFKNSLVENRGMDKRQELVITTTNEDFEQEDEAIQTRG